MKPLRGPVAWLAALFWTLFGLISGMQIWISMITHGHSLARVVVYQILVWDLWIVLSFAVARLLRQAPLVPARARNVLLHVLVACVFATIHAAWWAGLMFFLKPYDALNPAGFVSPFLKTAFFQLPLELLLYALVASALFAGDYYRRYREGEVSAARLERSLAEARLHALEQQIQPHFLFNTLNAVSALIRSGQAAEAVEMIGGLSDLLRYALDRAGDQRVAVDDEVRMLRRYLEIQRVRFADRLSFDIDVDPGAGRGAVPVLLLQPLAENAIRHGIARSAAPGTLRVHAFRLDEALRIEMLNSGRLPSGIEYGIGLSNTVARLAQLYGERQTFELVQEGSGVVARLTIPWSEVA
jgi:two-component system, LytTR family, sensor kinase